MRIAFIGLGRMGIGMAQRLLGAGHELVVWNRTPGKVEELGRERVTVARTPAEAVRGVVALVSMVANDAALESVVLGPDGVLGALAPHAVHVSSSTIAPVTAQRLAAEHARVGARYLAAPVLGRPDAAARGDLVALVAGADDARADAAPIFAAIARETQVVGQDAASANVVKLCVNFVLASMLESLGEAYALSESWGVSAESSLAALDALFRSPVIAAYGGKIARREFDPAGFALALGAKDVRLAVEAADARAASMPFAKLLHDRFAAAIARGLSNVDWSAIARS